MLVAYIAYAIIAAFVLGLVLAHDDDADILLAVFFAALWPLAIIVCIGLSVGKSLAKKDEEGR